MKHFLKFLKWSGVTLALLLAIFLGINGFDEALDPGALAILNSQSKVKAEDNAYFYWMGIRTAPPKNPSEFGQKCLLAQIKTIKSGAVLSDPQSIPECREQNPLNFVEDKSVACEWRKQPCLEQYFERRKTIDGLSAQNQAMMERYGRLLEFNQFDDAHYFDPFSVYVKAIPSRLYQAISASRLQDGDTQGFIRRTQAETRFYRVVLSGESTLLSKMIGSAWLARSARLVSDAVKLDPMFARQNQMALLAIAQPFSPGERGLGNTMEAEFRFLNSTLRDIDSENAPFFERWLYKLTFKKNATSNYLYSNISVWRKLTELPTEQYLAAEKPALEYLTNPWRDGYLKLAYNPAGKILAGVSGGAYANYPRRLIDVDGLLRLVSLQIQIAAQKIPESEIPDFLKNADPRFRNPYTGQAMQWDKEQGLHFQGHAKEASAQDGVVSVKL